MLYGLSKFHGFEQACKAQGVVLDAQLVEAARQGRSSMDALTHMPNTLYVALSEAAAMVRDNPRHELANQPVDVSSFKDDLRTSTPVTTLAAIINASLSPLPDAPGVVSISCDKSRTVDTCLQAEQGFGQVVAQMRNPRQPLPRHYETIGYQLVTHNGTPIGIRKGVGERSFCTFVEFRINGIPFPPGSLLRIETPDETERSGAYTYNSIRTAEQRVDSGLITTAAYMRPSAWALPPAERPAFLRPWYIPMQPPLVREVLRTPLSGLVAIAEGAMPGLSDWTPQYSTVPGWPARNVP